MLANFEHLSCYSQRKVKNSESKSQQRQINLLSELVVIHSVKLKILKANHNYPALSNRARKVVIHSVKLKILKANHNAQLSAPRLTGVVIHSVKLKILKANHN